MRLLPIAYAARNLGRSPGRLAQLVAGSALVVLLVLAASAFARGMGRTLTASGDASNAILLGAGAEGSIERSALPAGTAGIVAAGLPGLRTRLDEPAVSAQIHHEGLVTFAEGQRQAMLRGIDHHAFAVHRQARLVEGHLPRADEVLAGRLAHHRLGVPADRLAVGSTLVFEGRTWTISGRFAAPGTILESELWVDLGELMTATRRDTVSCVVVGMGEATFADIETFVLQRLDLELAAVAEDTYYGDLSRFFRPLQAMAWLTAALIAAGAAFGGFNTLYAAFAARIRELATLQAIGFSRGAILVSLLIEAGMTGIAGTVFALVAALVWLDGWAVAFSSGIFTLSMDPTVLGHGLLAGLVVGVLGTLPPAWRCLSPPLPAALRAA